MTQFLVSVPEEEAEAFLLWLEQRGFAHEVPAHEVPLWQQELVLRRIASSKPEDYTATDETLIRLRSRLK